LGVHRYKTAHFKGYFLGARADLDIFFEFAPVMVPEGRMRGLFYIFSCSLIKFKTNFRRKIYKLN
jgi:hypothetical protein